MQLGLTGAVTASTANTEIEVSYKYLYINNTGAVDLYISSSSATTAASRVILPSGTARYIPIQGTSLFHACASSTCTFTYEAFV